MVSTFFSGNKRTVTHCQRVCQRLALQHTLAMSKYDKYKKIHLKNNPRANHFDKNLIPKIKDQTEQLYYLHSTMLKGFLDINIDAHK